MKYSFTAYKSIYVFIISVLVVGCGEKTAQFSGDKVELKKTLNSDDQLAEPATAGSDAPAAPQYITKFFSLAPLESELEVVAQNSGIQSTEITLEEILSPESTSYSQISRPVVDDSFTQGISGSSYSQTFTQQSRGIVDILIVIDNSASMAQEQQNLSSKMLPLLSAINSSDWRIGVITTDGLWQGIINKGDQNAEADFQNFVQPGTSGSGYEKGIRSALSGLKMPNFVREGSTLAILIVSDEDNCSKGSSTPQCNSATDDLPSTLKSYIQNDLNKPLETDARVYGVINHDHCSTGFNVSTEYLALINDTKGAYGSICDADYSATLTAISNNVASILETEFYLDYIADENSASIQVNSSLWTDFSHSGQVITFTNPPADGASITITYTVGATEIKKEFDLSKTPADSTVSARINGVLMPSSSYVVDKAQKTLTFNATPAEAADIRISYREDGALTNSFDLPANTKDGSVSVKVNNVSRPFTINAGKLSLNDPAPDAASIVVNYHAIQGSKLEYPIATVGTNPKDFSAKDAVTGTAVAVTFDSGKIMFNQTDFVAGRKIKVQYLNPDEIVSKITLAHAPVKDSIEIVGTEEPCKFGSGIDVSPTNELLISCNLEGMSDITVKYKRRVDTVSTFTLDSVTNPDLGQWRVELNGVEIKDFSRSGKAITLKSVEKLPADAKLKLEYSSLGF